MLLQNDCILRCKCPTQGKLHYDLINGIISLIYFHFTCNSLKGWVLDVLFVINQMKDCSFLRHWHAQITSKMISSVSTFWHKINIYLGLVNECKERKYKWTSYNNLFICDNMLFEWNMFLLCPRLKGLYHVGVKYIMYPWLYACFH